MVLLEVFQAGELEQALEDVEQFPSREFVPGPLSSDREVIRVNLQDGAEPPTYSVVYRALAEGIPMIVSGIRPGDRNLTPEYFINKHGDTMVTLTNTKTGSQRKVALRTFMDSFGKPVNPESPEKLQDWPPTADFAVKFPEIFDLFEDCLIAPWITSRRGPLNLETNMPMGSCPPDTGPKAYLAHGAAGGTTTRLHGDMADAINIMFHEEDGPEDGSEGGALWIMIDRNDMARAAERLRKTKRGLFGDGHPIHSQQLNLTEEDVQDLRSAGVRVWTLIQRQGDAVFIPVGVGHQVTNNTPCVKIAVDFVAAPNLEHSQRISEELREHRLASGDTAAEDVLQLSSMCWWMYKRWKVEGLADTRSDPNSDPWISNYSAAPVYMPISLAAIKSGRLPRDVNSQDSTISKADVSVEHSAGALSNTSYRDNRRPYDAQDSPVVDHVQSPGSSSSAAVPSKRKTADEALTRTQKRRLKKERSVRNKSLGDPDKTLECPVGGCKRALDHFDRRTLLSHLERAHTARVLFLHRGQSNIEIAKERSKVLSIHPLDDVAFRQYMRDEVLSGLKG
ncbi:unnamed protein product [Peniophora sp. CBMAI 1063]|nr:unnamed protein product [Peniophora sp. CBMAI 1063]